MNQSSIQSRKEFDEVVNHAGQYVTKWMRNQINNLTANQKLLILVGSQYLLGEFKIYQEQDLWLVEDSEIIIHGFLSRSLAILYCLHYNSNDIAEAKQLLNLDLNLNLLLTDKTLYLKHLANNNISAHRRVTLEARLSETVRRINTLTEQLKKILILAKYKKIRKIL
jgi:hypothetical protein